MGNLNDDEELLDIFKQNGFDIAVSNCHMPEIGIPEFLEIVEVKISSCIKKPLQRTKFC